MKTALFTGLKPKPQGLTGHALCRANRTDFCFTIWKALCFAHHKYILSKSCLIKLTLPLFFFYMLYKRQLASYLNKTLIYWEEILHALNWSLCDQHVQASKTNWMLHKCGAFTFEKLLYTVFTLQALHRWICSLPQLTKQKERKNGLFWQY